MSHLAGKVTNGLKWSAIDRLLTQGIQLGLMLTLARYIGPEAFGLVGMLAVFMAVANVFVDSGISSALTRKKNRTEKDFSTAFFYNIIVSLTCYGVIYVTSPLVSDFYEQNELCGLLRVMGVTILLNACSLVPRVKLTVDMNFKAQALASISGIVVSGVVSIFIVLNGGEVWALVSLPIISSLISMILLNYSVRWLPKDRISLKSFKYLFGFGSKLLISSLLDVIYNNLVQVLIGKKFAPVIVGHFTQANQLASVSATTITTIIQRVTYPMFTQLQGNEEGITNAYRTTLKLSAILIFPLLAGIGIIAEPMIRILLGEKWIESAILLSLLSFGYMLYPVHAVNLNILQVKGRSDIFLKLEIIKKLIGFTLIILTFPHGVKAMCISLVITSYLSFILNAYYTATVASLSLYQQLKDIVPTWIAVILFSGGGYIVGVSWSEKPWNQLVLSLLSALIPYLVYIRASHGELIFNAISTLKDGKSKNEI